jgi:hypothetical protein
MLSLDAQIPLHHRGMILETLVHGTHVYRDIFADAATSFASGCKLVRFRR